MPVKTMASPRRSAAAMTSWSLTEPPGWMTAVAPAAATVFEAVGEGKEGVGGGDGAGERQYGLLRTEAGGVDAAHLAGADADGLAIPRRRRWRLI